MMTRENCRRLVATLTQLGIQPGPNTETDCLCLTDDPQGATIVDESDASTLHSYWVGWDTSLSKWVVAHQAYDESAAPLDQQDAEHYVDGGWQSTPFQGW